MNDHAAFMAQHHELIARLNDVEAPLTSFGDQLTEGCVVLHVNDRPSHHASLLRLLGVEDLRARSAARRWPRSPDGALTYLST